MERGWLELSAVAVGYELSAGAELSTGAELSMELLRLRRDVVWDSGGGAPVELWESEGDRYSVGIAAV